MSTLQDVQPDTAQLDEITLLERSNPPGNEVSGTQFTRNGAWLGARRTVPLAVGSFAFSVVFGVLARQAGMSLFEAALMSSLVFAGASQLIAVGLWVLPLPAATLIITTLIVNLRHLLMGASLRPWFSGLPRSKAYGTLFWMTDETWALTLRYFTGGGRDAAFLIGGGLTLYIPWVMGTILGEVLGSGISTADLARWALDFIFTAVFTTLAVSMWRGKRDLLPWIVAGVVALVAEQLLPGKWYILLGGMSGSLVGAWRDAR